MARNKPEILLDGPFPLQELAILATVIFSSAISLSGLFPYVGFMVVDLGMSSEIDSSGFYAGYLAAGMMVGRLTSSIFWGQMADRFGRKPVLSIGCGSIITFSLLFGLSLNFWMALSSRFLMGLFNPIIGISKTVVSEICPKKHEASGMGVVTGCWNLGLIFGPAFGGFLSHPTDNMPTLFGNSAFLKRFPYLLPNVVTATFAAIGLVCLLLKFPETLVQNDIMSECSTGEDGGIECKEKPNPDTIDKHDESDWCHKLTNLCTFTWQRTSSSRGNFDSRPDYQYSLVEAQPECTPELEELADAGNGTCTDESIVLNHQQICPFIKDPESTSVSRRINIEMTLNCNSLMKSSGGTPSLNYKDMQALSEEDDLESSSSSSHLISTRADVIVQPRKSLREEDKQDVLSTPASPPFGSREMLNNDPRPDSALIEDMSLWQLVTLPGVWKILLTYMLISVVAIAFDEVLPLWTMSTYKNGGFSMKVSQVGDILSITGIVLVVFTLSLYPILTNRWGQRFACQIGQLTSVPPVVGVSFLRLLPETFPAMPISLSMGLVTAGYIWFKMSTTLAFSSLALIINQSVPQQKRASMNGIAMTLGSLAKSVGPVTGSVIYAWSISDHHKFPFDYHLVFVLLSIICLLSYFLFLSIPLPPQSISPIIGAAQS